MKGGASVENIKTSGIVEIHSSSNPDIYGGITSVLEGSTIKSCENGALIKGEIGKSLGGIAGETKNSGNTIQSCKNIATTIGADNITNVGGIVGYAGGAVTLIGCSNTGSIISSTYAGGLIGMVNTSSVSIESDGSVTSSNSGQVQSTGDYAGGFVGCTSMSITIKGTSSIAAMNTNNVMSKTYAGGFIGYNLSTADIDYCLNSGKITATSESVDVYAGGFIGYSKGADIDYSSNNGDVAATNAVSSWVNAYAGGFVGRCDGTFTGGSSGSSISNDGSVRAQVDHSSWFSEAGGIEAGEKTWSGLRPLGVRIRAVDEGEWLGFDYYKCGSLYVYEYYGYAGGFIGYGNNGSVYGINNGTITGSLLRWIDNLNQYKPVGMDVYCKATAHWIETRGYIAGGGSITAHAMGDTLDLSSYTLNSPPEEGSGYEAILSALQSGSPPIKGGSCEKAAETGNFPIFGLNSKECQGISASWGIAYCAKQIYK